MIDKSIISSWVRQARHRAKKHDIYNKLTARDVEDIVDYYNNNCTYCENDADILDHPFPLKDLAPNVPANVLPCCKICKNIKKTNDLVWMFTNQKINSDKYLLLLKELLGRDGSKELKKHIKKITGMDD